MTGNKYSFPPTYNPSFPVASSPTYNPGLLGQEAVPLPTFELDFSQDTFPAELTYARTSAEIGIDDTGEWVEYAANTPILDYDYNGTRIGWRKQEANVTNKCTNYNWDMAATTNMTTSGNAGGILSVGTHPVHGFDTFVMDTTQGAGPTGGTFSVQIGGAFANTNPHSMQIAYYIETAVGGNDLWINDSNGAGTTAVNGDATDEGLLKLENHTPGNSAYTMQVNIPQNAKVHFWANQLEEREHCTPPIIVAGASANRVYDTITMATANITGFRSDKMTLIMDVKFDILPSTSDVDVSLWNIRNSGDSGERVGMTLESSTNGQARADLRHDFTTNFSDDIHRPTRGRRFPSAVGYDVDAGDVLSVAGPMSFEIGNANPVIEPDGMNEIWVGSFRNNLSHVSGWLDGKLRYFPQLLTHLQCATYMLPTDNGQVYIGVPMLGQSNNDGNFRSTQDKLNGGEEAMLGYVEAAYPSAECWILNCSSDGSALRASGGTNAWINSDDESDGLVLIKSKQIATAFGIQNIPAAGSWDQGASDSNRDPEDIADDTIDVFNRWRAHVGTTKPMNIRPIAARDDGANNNYNNVKRGQETVANTLSNVKLSSAQNKVTLGSDNIHLHPTNDGGYPTYAEPSIRQLLDMISGISVTGPVDPPTLGTPSRVTTTVTIPVTFPSGVTALTPTTGIAGFRCFDDDDSDGSFDFNTDEIEVNAAIFTGGNIELTLDSEPTGDLYIYYGLGTLYLERVTESDKANLPVADSVYLLELQNAELVIAA